MQNMDSLWRRRWFRYSYMDRKGLISRIVFQRADKRSLYAYPGKIRWSQFAGYYARARQSYTSLRHLQKILSKLAMSDEVWQSGKIATFRRTVQCHFRKKSQRLSRSHRKLQKYILQHLPIRRQCRRSRKAQLLLRLEQSDLQNS